MYAHCLHSVNKICILKSHYWWTSCSHAVFCWLIVHNQWKFLVVSLSMGPRLTYNGNSIQLCHFDSLHYSPSLTLTHRSLNIPGGTWIPRRGRRGGSSRPSSRWGLREMRFARSQRGSLRCIRRGNTSSSSCLENKKIHNWKNFTSRHFMIIYFNKC